MMPLSISFGSNFYNFLFDANAQFGDENFALYADSISTYGDDLGNYLSTQTLRVIKYHFALYELTQELAHPKLTEQQISRAFNNIRQFLYDNEVLNDELKFMIDLYFKRIKSGKIKANANINHFSHPSILKILYDDTKNKFE